FYDEQAELIGHYENDEKLLSGEIPPVDSEPRIDRILNYTHISLNVILLFANLTAAILSGSLSIISTFVESAMDLTTGLIMGLCLHLIKKSDFFKYPRGRERLETVGVILCAVIMGISNIVIILHSLNAIVHGNVIALDMRNDIATSSVAIVAAFIGSRFIWKYADPVGACLVCSIIAFNWFAHALEHIPSLTGVRAEQEHLSRVLRIGMQHDDRIQKIDHVMLYHIGAKAMVEMHIVMEENLPLKITHDISHPLEKKINQIDFVDRSFVHCDYACDGD
ncbi:hypothetical protein PMAYCL1PPCAC_26099, partial [Pristionchus mayeri]